MILPKAVRKLLEDALACLRCGEQRTALRLLGEALGALDARGLEPFSGTALLDAKARTRPVFEVRRQRRSAPATKEGA